MALGDLFKGDTGKGIAIGLAAAALTPVLVPVVAGVGRPFARAAVKGGLLFYEKSRETAAEMGEVLDDLVAEARSEMEEGAQPDFSEEGAAPGEGAQEGSRRNEPGA